MTDFDPQQKAVELADALSGPDIVLRGILSGAAGPGYGVLREAAALIEQAAGDPVDFAARHGDPFWNSIRIDAAARDRLLGIR